LFRKVDKGIGWRGACSHVLRNPNSFLSDGKHNVIDSCNDYEYGRPMEVKGGDLPVRYVEELRYLEEKMGPGDMGFRTRILEIVEESAAEKVDG